MGEDTTFVCVTMVVHNTREDEEFRLTISPFDDMEGVRNTLAKAMGVDTADDVVLTGSYGIVALEAVMKSMTAYLKTHKRCIILETEYKSEGLNTNQRKHRYGRNGKFQHYSCNVVNGRVALRAGWKERSGSVHCRGIQALQGQGQEAPGKAYDRGLDEVRERHPVGDVAQISRGRP